MTWGRRSPQDRPRRRRLSGFSGRRGQAARAGEDPGFPDDDEQRTEGLVGDLAELNRDIKLHPADAYAISSRGQVYLAIGRYDEALADLGRAVELDPDDPLVFSARGETYRLMGRFDEALADLGHAIELYPEYAWAISTCGQIHEEMERYDEALTDHN